MFKEEQEPRNSGKEMNRNTNIGAGKTIHHSTHEKQVQNQQTRNFTERVQLHQTTSQYHGIEKKGNGVNLDLQLQHSSLHNLVAEKQTQNGGANEVPPQIRVGEVQDLPLRVVSRLDGAGGQGGLESPSVQVDHYKPAGQQAGRTLSMTTLHKEDTSAYVARGDAIDPGATAVIGGTQWAPNIDVREAETANTGGNLNPSSNQGGEHRRRPSGWDVLPTVGSGNLNTGDSRLSTPTSGGPIRNRYNFTKKMGNGAGLRRNRGTTADKIGSPYTTRGSRFSAGVNSYGGEDDPMSIRTPSPSSSTGSLGSRYGAFSPPPIISDKYVGLEVATSYDDIGKTTQVQGQNQDNKNSSANEIPPLGGSLDGDMDVDGAMAPALKAPREP